MPTQIPTDPKVLWWMSSYEQPIIPRLHGFTGPADVMHIIAWTSIVMLTVLWFTVYRVVLTQEEDHVLTPIMSVLAVLTTVLKVVTTLSKNEDKNSIWAKKYPKLQFGRLMPPTTEYRPCFYCRQFVFKQSKHCSICDKCVEGFDHHCRWLNTCIGSKNYKLFFAFVLSALTSILLQFVMGIILFARYFVDSNAEMYQVQLERFYGPSGASTVAWLFFAAFGIVFKAFGGFAVGNLLCFHIYLRCTDRTTYSWIQENRAKEREKEKRERDDRKALEQQRESQAEPFSSLPGAAPGPETPGSTPSREKDYAQAETAGGGEQEATGSSANGASAEPEVAAVVSTEPIDETY